MCVISIIENKNQIPSNTMVDKMYKENPHYSGIAYFNENAKQIYYKKGIEAKEIKKIMKKAKHNKNIIQHYRIASHGSATNKLLNHCFVIENGYKNRLEGITNSDVLFHNGTLDMAELKDMAKKIMVNNPSAIFPKGELSDTYLLSFILSHVDYSILELFTDGNKFTIMNGKTGKITKYGSWYDVKDGKNTLNCSNDYFTHDYTFNTNDYTFNTPYDNYQFLDNKEKKEIKRLLKIYTHITENDIHDFLDMGYDLFELDDVIKNELDYEGYDY
jgi:hypothetical protein